MEQNKKSLYEPNPNGQGFAFGMPCVLIDEWISCWKGQRPLLDIGCGNGCNIQLALERGAQVVATEIDENRLSALQNDPQWVGRFGNQLELVHGLLPDAMPFDDASFDGILCAEVFHFLPYPDVIASIWELHRLLAPGGLIALTCISTKVQLLQSTGLEQRVERQRQRNPVRLAGYMDYIQLLEEATADRRDEPEVKEMIAGHIRQIPGRCFHFFIAEQLGEIFRQMGFDVLLCEEGPAPHYPIVEHGDRDQVRILARKP